MTTSPGAPASQAGKKRAFVDLSVDDDDDIGPGPAPAASSSSSNHHHGGPGAGWYNQKRGSGKKEMVERVECDRPVERSA